MKSSYGVVTDFITMLIRILAGLTTVVCIVWSAVNGDSFIEMGFWLLVALVAFSVNLFGCVLLSRMITSSIGLESQ